MELVINDGGREASGFRGKTGDCATRAIAIATGIPYSEVYAALAALNATKGGKRTAAKGIWTEDAKKYMASIGWKWHATMGIGTGCTMHLNEVPRGRIVARVSKHYCAVINGVVHDTFDSTRDGNRCVYGYWSKP